MKHWKKLKAVVPIWLLVVCLGSVVVRSDAQPVQPREDAVPYVVSNGRWVQVGTSEIELQIDEAGHPVGLFDKWNGQALPLSSRLPWWRLLWDGGEISLSSQALEAEFSIVTQGVTHKGRWTWRSQDPLVTVETFVWPETDGGLCLTYVVTNGELQPLKQVYFPMFMGLPRDRGGYIAFPERLGRKIDLADFELQVAGGPGHLSMQMVGAKIGPSALLSYPEDPTGHFRFLWATDEGSADSPAFGLFWENRDWILPKECYSPPFAYRLYVLPRADLRGIAEAYREWAIQQPWYVSWEEKTAGNPLIGRVLNGVVKMTGFEGIGGSDPSGRVYWPWEQKQADSKVLTYDYERFLNVARNLERRYRVKPAYRYDGWYGRFDSRYPDYFPVDPQLGDFDQFIATNNAEERLVYLHTNPIQYDYDAPSYDSRKMAMWQGKFSGGVWSHNRLLVGSPRLIREDQVRAEQEMVARGVQGIFEDVIGATTVMDDNPHAGYAYITRDAGNLALMELMAALRQATPGVYKATEEGEERRIPYFDGMFFSIPYAQPPAEDIPLFSMVYGDTYVLTEEIGGGGDGTNDLRRAQFLLFGAVLGVDGRIASVARDEFSPHIQMTFETQKVAGETARHRILDYTWSGDLRMTQWADAITVANLGETAVPETTFSETTLGEVRLEGLRPYGVVCFLRDGRFAAWGVQSLTCAGRQLFSHTARQAVALIWDGQRLALALVEKAAQPERITVRLSNVKLIGQLTERSAAGESSHPANALAEGGWSLTLSPGTAVYLE